MLALYILKRRGHDRPSKKQVLNFISWNRLMHVPADDSDLRSTGDEIWENDLAFRRADLKDDGLLDKPDWNVWHLTKRGEENVQAWAHRIKELHDKDPNFADNYKFDPTDELSFEFYITPKAFEFAMKIVTGTLQ